MTSIDGLGDLRGKRVLVRSDLNVPLDGDTITDDGRIRASVPTITALTEAGARVIVCAHLGRPKGAPDPKYSLAPVAERLGELLGHDVTFATDTVGDSARPRSPGSTDGDVVLLENLRFNAGRDGQGRGGAGGVRRRARRPGRRLRLRRLRCRPPQAGVGLRRRQAAAGGDGGLVRSEVEVSSG